MQKVWLENNSSSDDSWGTQSFQQRCKKVLNEQIRTMKSQVSSEQAPNNQMTNTTIYSPLFSSQTKNLAYKRRMNTHIDVNDPSDRRRRAWTSHRA